MQNLINANQKSTTEQLMNDVGTVVPFYKESPSMPPLGIMFHNQTPTIDVSGAIDSKSCLIDFPGGGGFMFDCSVSIRCVSAVTADDVAVKNYPGINMVRYIQFESGGQILIYKTKNSIYTSIMDNKNETLKLFSLRHASILDPVTEEVLTGARSAGSASNQGFLTYLPMMESFLTKPEKALLLDNLKDLKLRIMFDNAALSGMTNAISIGDSGIKLVVQTYMPKLSVFNEMKVNDWSKSFLMEMINMDEEVQPLTSTTSTKIVVNTSFLVAKTHISIRAINSTPGLGLPFKKITGISFNLNGTPLLDGTIKPSRILSAAARYGASHINMTGQTVVAAAGPPIVTGVVPSQAVYEPTEVYTLDWGILAGRDMNSGTAFFQELRGSSITVTYDTDAGYGDYILYLNHEYWQGASYNPGNGGGTIMIQSVS